MNKVILLVLILIVSAWVYLFPSFFFASHLLEHVFYGAVLLASAIAFLLGVVALCVNYVNNTFINTSDKLYYRKY